LLRRDTTIIIVAVDGSGRWEPSMRRLNDATDAMRRSDHEKMVVSRGAWILLQR